MNYTPAPQNDELFKAQSIVDSLHHLVKASYWNRSALEDEVDDAQDNLGEAREKLDEDPENEDLHEQCVDFEDALKHAQEKLDEALEYQVELYARLSSAEENLNKIRTQKEAAYCD